MEREVHAIAVNCSDALGPVLLQEPETILGLPLLLEVPPAAAQTSPHGDFDEFDGDELPGAEAEGFKPVVLCSPGNLNFRK